MALDTLGKRLTYARDRKGIKQKFAAEKVGVAAPTLANYEADYRKPDLETLHLLAEMYEVTIDWLVSGDDRTQYASPVEMSEKISLADLKELLLEDRLTVGGNPISASKKALMLAVIEDAERDQQQK